MKGLLLLAALALLPACGELSTVPDDAGPLLGRTSSDAGPNFVDATNALLAEAGSEYRIAYVELLTTRPDLASPNIIIASNVGNKRLAFDFIPNDPRRGGLDGDPNTIDTWVDLVDGVATGGLDAAATTGAIAGAMGTWDAQTCSELGVRLIPVPFDLGLVQDILGFGGGIVVSDVMHAGWLPGAFFDAVVEDGSTFVLGATFTLTFAEGDLNMDGLPDLGAREIYYNNAFAWTDSGQPGLIDAETIALHEAGHALSQAHFGKVFYNSRTDEVVFSPRAVMNAVYSGPNRALDGTDLSGHCGIWDTWPAD